MENNSTQNTKASEEQEKDRKTVVDNNKPYVKKRNNPRLNKASQLPSKTRINKTQNNNKNHIYGVIDLGTNNCRLLVAVPTIDGFKVIDAFSRIVRLGEGLNEDKNISEEAISRTISALRICVDKMQRRGVTQMWNVATQACREAENRQKFIEIVEKEVHIKLNIIEPKEEARLAVMGCKALLDTQYKRAIIFDIGGGSTEIIWIEFNLDRKPKIIDWLSIPLGVVNLSEEYGTNDVLEDAHYQEMKDRVKEYLISFENNHNILDLIKDNQVQLMGSSGTVTTLTSMHLNQQYYDRSQVDGSWMKMTDLVQLCQKLSKLNLTERLALKNIGNDRAELVVAGCAILDALVEIWPVENIRVADRGIREGMLHELIDRQKQKNKDKRRRRNKRRKLNKHKNTSAGEASNAENSPLKKASL